MSDSVPLGERLRGENVLVVVAHQDDESLYFGGLLSQISPHCSVTLACVTAPMAGRRDSATRQESFRRVCEHLGAECHQFAFEDPGLVRFERIAHRVGPIAAILEELIRGCPYGIILTHNEAGEPNRAYRKRRKKWRKLLARFGTRERVRGHPAHRLVSHAVSQAVREASQKGVLERVPCVYQSGVGIAYNLDPVPINVAAKKRLLDHYLPNWSPELYPFCYEDEVYYLPETSIPGEAPSRARG